MSIKESRESTPRKWHYTVGARFLSIVSDGMIKLATAGLPIDEKPIVWFSTNPDWEQTANKLSLAYGKLIRLDRARTAELGGGLVRIGVAPETAPHDWCALKELSGMSGRVAQGLYRAAIEMGAHPGDWWGAFDAVSRSKWEVVQVYQDGTWIDIPLEHALERARGTNQ